MKDVTSVTRPASPAPGVDAYDLFDVTLLYQFNEKILVRGGVNNVVDEEPPIVGGTIGQTQPGHLRHPGPLLLPRPATGFLTTR